MDAGSNPAPASVVFLIIILKSQDTRPLFTWPLCFFRGLLKKQLNMLISIIQYCILPLSLLYVLWIYAADILKPNKAYSEDDLVRFGMYLVSDKRKQRLKDTETEIPLSDREKEVFDADIENWKNG